MKENVMDWVFMQSPTGEVKEVEATAAALSSLMVAGWRQVPAPAAEHEAIAQTPTAQAEEGK
jgi:hypothetical protein